MEHRWQEWCEYVLEPALNGQEPRPGAVEQYGGLALLAADTDRTQDYVFESSKLPEIRGGSELLRFLNEEGLPRLLMEAGLPEEFVDKDAYPSCVIYAGGGSLLAVVPASIAKDLAAEIERYYPIETGKATITCVCRPVSVDEMVHGFGGHAVSCEKVNAMRERLDAEAWQRIARAYGVQPGGPIPEEAFRQNHGFGQMVQVMGNLLRQKKDCPRSIPISEVLPHTVRCQICHVRSAEFVYPYFDETWPICDVCLRKVRTQFGEGETSQEDKKSGWAREARSKQVNRFLDWLDNNEPQLAARYLAEVPRHRIHHPQDLNELGSACQAREGYIGFIYADGNSMGQVLESLPTPLAYHKFSQALSKAIKSAAYQALAENLRVTVIDRASPTGEPLGKGFVHPLEPLVIGGDDVMLIVPGHAALPIAVRLCQLFEEKMQEYVSTEIGARLPAEFRHPTISAGIVIADSHNPVRILQHVSKELCKTAKRRAYNERQKELPIYTSALDFLLLKSQSMLRRNVKQLRQIRPYYYDERGKGRGLRRGRFLTAAPYTLEESLRLLRILKLMRQVDFATSQLQSLVAALQRGRQYGSIHYLYQQARLKSRLGVAEQDKNVLERLPQIWPYEDQHEPVPWHHAPGHGRDVFASIVPDLLELYPLIPKPAPEDLWCEILTESGHDDQS